MRSLFAVGAACLVIALPGCGGDDDEGKKSPSPTRPAAETVNVTETDFKLDPSDPTLSEAGVVRFAVANKGEVEHSLEVEGPQGETELKENIQPGKSATLEVDLDKPGRYEWYCPVGNHRDLGMEGEITVKGGGGSSSSGSQGETQESGGRSY
jgi:plastocyanin